MNAKAKSQLIILVVAVVICFVLIREAFKMLDLSIKDYPKFKPGTKTKADWFAYVTPLAKAIGKEFGLPWKAIAVQSALETAWGKSSLFEKYNNWGGIKDTDGINSTAPMSTIEYTNGVKETIKDGFEIYPSPYEGLRGYAKLITGKKRYAAALKYPNDPYKYIEELKKAGYATDPNYVAKLHKLLNENFA